MIDSILLACTLGALQVGKLAIKAQKVWLEAVQTRVAATASTLSSIKGIKMMGLTNCIADDLQCRRVSELNQFKSYRKVTTAQNVVSEYNSYNSYNTWKQFIA
jgi:ATP-binding cassette subfamily C (CFTR/MRP) protein 1